MTLSGLALRGLLRRRMRSLLTVAGIALGIAAVVTLTAISWGFEHSWQRANDARGTDLIVTRATSENTLPSPFEAVRYHSLAALELPDELVATAHDERTGLVMGVRHRELAQVGVQFHPESVLTEHGARLVANFLSVAR